MFVKSWDIFTGELPRGICYFINLISFNDASPRACLREYFWTYCITNRRRYSLKIAVLTDFTIFTRHHLCWSFLFKKVAALHPRNLIKKRLQHRCFPVDIAKFLRTPILKNICKRLLLILKCFKIILKHFKKLFSQTATKPSLLIAKTKPTLISYLLNEFRKFVYVQKMRKTWFFVTS